MLVLSLDLRAKFGYFDSCPLCFAKLVNFRKVKRPEYFYFTNFRTTNGE